MWLKTKVEKVIQLSSYCNEMTSYQVQSVSELIFVTLLFFYVNSGRPSILCHSIKFTHKCAASRKRKIQKTVAKRPKPKNANKTVKCTVCSILASGLYFPSKHFIAERFCLCLSFQTGTLCICLPAWVSVCLAVLVAWKHTLLLQNCNTDLSCVCVWCWWWLRIISVGTKATNTSVPSDLSDSPIFTGFVDVVSASSHPPPRLLCMIPFHFGHCFHNFFFSFILLFRIVMLLMRNSCAFLSPSKWNTRTKKINSFYGSVKQWNFHFSNQHTPFDTFGL